MIKKISSFGSAKKKKKTQNKKHGKRKISDINHDAESLILTRKELLECHKKYHELINNINDAIYYLDKKGNVIYASPSIKQITGYDADDMLGHSALEFVYPKDRFRTKEKIKAVLSGKSEPFETRLVRKDGSIAYVRSFGRLLSDNKKKTKRIVSVLTDITDRKKAEEALRESEERFRDIYDNAPFGIFHSTPEGKVIRVNPAFASMLKYDSPEELIRDVNRTNIGEHLYVKPDVRSTVIDKIGRYPGWHKFENSYLCKNGKTIIVSVSLRKIINPVTSQEELEGFAEDITERKEAEAKLVESYKYLGTINRQVSILLELNNILDEKNKKGMVDFVVWSALEISNSKFAALYKYDPDRKEKKLRLVSLASTFDVEKMEKDRVAYLSMKYPECLDDIKYEKIDMVEECLKETSLEKFRTKHDISNFYVLPILKKEELEGILVLGFSAKKELNDQERGFYNVFAKYASFILLHMGALKDIDGH